MRCALFVLTLFVQSWQPPSEADVKRAEKKLSEKPDDPAASLAFGKILMLRGEWDRAIPYLAKGSDDFFKTIAEKELSRNDPFALGDSWWTGSVEIEAHLLTGATATAKIEAKREAARFPVFFRERAFHHYAKAWPTLVPPARDRVREKFASVCKPPPIVGGGAGQPTGLDTLYPVWKSDLDNRFARTGRSSMRILPAGKDNTVGYTGFHSLPIPVTPKKKYHASAWVFTDRTDADGTLHVRFFDHGGKFVSYSGASILKDAPFWQRIETEGVVPDGSFKVDVNFTMLSKAGATWIDDISLKVDGRELFTNGGFER